MECCGARAWPLTRVTDGSAVSSAHPTPRKNYGQVGERERYREIAPFLVLKTPSKSFGHCSLPRVMWWVLWEVKSMSGIFMSLYRGKLFLHICKLEYLEQGCGSGSAWIRINLSCWIRIRIRIPYADPDPGGQKWPTKTEKSDEISCFELLDVLFWELEASPVAWPSFIEAQGQVNCNFWSKKYNFFPL